MNRGTGRTSLGNALKLFCCLCLVALVMSCVISNSATANLLIPIGMSLATSGTVDMSPAVASVFIA